MNLDIFDNLGSNITAFWKDYKLVLSGTLAALALIEILVAYNIGNAIESEIHAKTFARLAETGFKRVEPRVSGRDVTLDGKVSSDVAQALAMEIADSVRGVRVVYSALEINPLRLPHLRLTRHLDGTLGLEGEVPTQKLATEISGITTAAIDHDSLNSDIVIDPEVTVPRWLQAVGGIVQEGNRLQSMEIVIGAGQVSLGGLLESQTDYNVLARRLDQFSEDHALKFVNKIGIIPAHSASSTSPSGPTAMPENEAVTTTALTDSGSSVAIPDSVTEPDRNNNPISKDQQLSDNGAHENVDGNGQSSTESRPGTSPHLESCQNRLNETLKSFPITFLPNIAEISVDNYTSIEKTRNILDSCPTYNISIGGHTDSRGNPDTNLDLSRNRAKSVMQALVEMRIGGEQVTARGFGSTQPVASNESVEGRRLNRRIEITLAVRG